MERMRDMVDRYVPTTQNVADPKQQLRNDWHNVSQLDIRYVLNYSTYEIYGYINSIKMSLCS